MEILDHAFKLNDWGFQESPVYQALFVSDEFALENLQNLQKPLSLGESARCLKKAMQDCSLEVFRQLLVHCPPGVCMEHYQPNGMAMGWGLNGTGSLLLLAAMMDRPHHAQLLLERGYDCNGADIGLGNHNRGMQFVSPYVRFGGTSENTLFLNSPQEISSIDCATPLAAALLCGSLQTAEVLLREQSIWKAESSSVCRAAAMVLEGMTRHLLAEEQKQNQLEILRRIFCPELTHRRIGKLFCAASLCSLPAMWISVPLRCCVVSWSPDCVQSRMSCRR